MQLGWERDKARLTQLGGLGVDGVRDVLRNMGNPLDGLAPRFDIVRRLHELSEGDPLLVRLYVETLLPQDSRAATFTPNDLLRLQRGLKPFLARWFEEQKRLWAADARFSAAERDCAVNGLLNACALAKGPLAREDVLRVAEVEVPDTPALTWATDALSRFIIGDGSAQNGYVFSHPRLADHFADRLTRRERNSWQIRYLRYGRETLLALNDTSLKPVDASLYIIHYYGAHLQEADVSGADLYALMSEGWKQAWEWADGTPDGFLGDCDRGWGRAEAEGGAALAQIARAALCHASVASVGANIPTELLTTCVRGEVISVAYALVLARAKLDLKDRVEALAALSALATDQQAEVLAEALQTASAIQDEGERASALSAVAVELPAERQADVLTEALRTAGAIQDEQKRADALRAVAARLPADQPELLAEALRMACALQEEWPRAGALSAVAARLPVDQPELLAEALRAAGALQDERKRADALSAVAARLPSDQPELLAEALRAAGAIQEEWPRADALIAVTARLPSEEPELLMEALGMASAIRDEWRQALALSAVAARLPVELPAGMLTGALRVADRFYSEIGRAEAKILCTLATWLPAERQARVLAEALRVAGAIHDERERSWALSAVAEWLPADQPEVLAKALRVADAIHDEGERVHVLRAVAERLPADQPKLLAEALRVAGAIQDEGERFWALRCGSGATVERPAGAAGEGVADGGRDPRQMAAGRCPACGSSTAAS